MSSTSLSGGNLVDGLPPVASGDANDGDDDDDDGRENDDS